MSDPGRPLRAPAALHLAIGSAAALAAAIAAARVAWTCDDAFISFRYARNLVDGLGLVFNPGERVEGYSNFLWTLWVAAGMKLGADPEVWSIAWGIAFFAGTILLLAAWSARARARAAWERALVPLAAVILAAHPDAQVFATSGLETSLFTFQAVAFFLLLTGGSRSRARAAAAGAMAALLAMSRPEGVLFAAIGGLWLLAFRAPRLPAALAYAAGFLPLWAAYTGWRLWYFGDFFPNTYYAKSAHLAWYSQGWTYLWVYFRKYWILLPGLPLAAIAPWRLRPGRASLLGADDRSLLEETLLAGALAAGYAAFVLRVGGDFMFARLLIPATPFLLILLELGLGRAMAGRPLPAGALAAACAVALWATPHPVPDSRASIAGIVNERLVYPPASAARERQLGERLAGRYFRDVPVRMAFMGGQARLAYYARPRIAIEAETGLTDRTIARQSLARRGRVGHEKHAPLEYLTRERGVHLTFHPNAPALLNLPGRLPREPIEFDDVAAWLLTWDPEVLEALRARGARFADFPARLDSSIAALDTLPDAQVRQLYEAVTNFYFSRVADPVREARFRRRLGLPAPAGGIGREAPRALPPRETGARSAAPARGGR